MRRSSQFNLINFTLIIFVIGSYVLVAQNAITGEWTASTKDEKPDKIQLSFDRRTEKGGRNQHGSSFALSDLQGLTREQAQNGRVTFRLVREAGTIECEGTFTNGRGVGTFRFVPNMAFVDAMRQRGFDFAKDETKTHTSKTDVRQHESPIEDKLFTAAMVNVTTTLADDLRSANFENLDVGDLFKAAIFKIDGKFMAEMKATGWPNMRMEELVKARIFKIDANYIRQVREMGFAESDFEQMVKFRIFKVTPEFLSELKSLGFADLNAEQIVKFRIFNISGDFIRQARAEEPNITIEQLVERKIGIRRRH
ncbi:MAG: hypothetical protein ABR535_05770 [Pyrinomonadaceae bacterium]